MTETLKRPAHEVILEELQENIMAAKKAAINDEVLARWDAVVILLRVFEKIVIPVQEMQRAARQLRDIAATCSITPLRDRMEQLLDEFEDSAPKFNAATDNQSGSFYGC